MDPRNQAKLKNEIRQLNDYISESKNGFDKLSQDAQSEMIKNIGNKLQAFSQMAGKDVMKAEIEGKTTVQDKLILMMKDHEMLKSRWLKDTKKEEKQDQNIDADYIKKAEIKLESLNNTMHRVVNDPEFLRRGQKFIDNKLDSVRIEMNKFAEDQQKKTGVSNIAVDDFKRKVETTIKDREMQAQKNMGHKKHQIEQAQQKRDQPKPEPEYKGPRLGGK